MKNTLLLALFIATGAMAVQSCKKNDDSDPTLYTRLGGNNSIKAVVDKFVEYVATDTVINDKFVSTIANNRVDNLKMQLVNQIGEASGGPEKYTGLSMKEAHKGMMITEVEFNALVADLGKALTFYNVPEKEQMELVNILAPLQPDIVGQ